MPSPIKILRVESFNVISMEPQGWRMSAKSKCETAFWQGRRGGAMVGTPRCCSVVKTSVTLYAGHR
jgi:hypothetical protein